MDDPDHDSTWEDEEEDEEEEDGGGPSAGGDNDGEAGALGDAEDEDEEEEEEEEARPSALQSRMTGSPNWRAMQDTRRYRHHYPDLMEGDSNGDMPNLSFYKNEIPFRPNGYRIEYILEKWRDNYDLLEDNHSYIQWLFPLREPGVNWHAKPLTQQEIEAFKSSQEAGQRLVQAYELMLGFYGIELEDRDTGKVRRAQSYQKRFQNLNWLRRLGPRAPPRPPLRGPEPAAGEASPADPFLEAGAPGRTCGPGRGAGGDGVAAGPPQEEGARERDPGAEEPEPGSPTESKKRKLQPNRREQAPGELGPQSASEVEKIAQNLEGCALSQGSLGAGTQEMGSQGPGETEQPCPPPPGAQVADEVRKRRKVDQAPAPSGRPEPGLGEEVEEDEAEGQGVAEQGAPGSPATAEPASDERAEAGLAARPPTP
ncbi:opioid growth factor receptor [Myotis lucifugus]|uniref:opioid growth factor receptor n=1 Tax=Myotis lucifugus TaxID=59463 RepID=UPI0003C44FF4|nr:opioid growth factor receptor [Myotis lucifugus]